MSRGLLLLVFAFAATLLCACPESRVVDDTGGSTLVAEAGVEACPSSPEAMINLTITALNAPVPYDTTLDVNWSAGPEPTFALDDPSTWGSLADGSNVVCDVDSTAPPPHDLVALVCHVWTIGATDIDVRAMGYDPYSVTLAPHISKTCKMQVPRAVAVVLMPTPDAGMP